MHSLSPLIHNFMTFVGLTLLITLSMYDYLGLLNPIELKRLTNTPVSENIRHLRNLQEIYKEPVTHQPVVFVFTDSLE